MTMSRDDPKPQADTDTRAVAAGMRALDEARAQGTLPPEAADRLAVEAVRAARQARRPIRSPWTDPDPQPGDFDADLDSISPRDLERRPGNPDAKATVIASAEDGKTDRG
jgi:hypothetical protein